VQQLRTPILLIAMILIVAVVLVEIGSTFILRANPVDSSILSSQDPDAFSKIDPSSLNNLSGNRPPGLGIPYLAVLDVLVLFTMALVVTALVIPERAQGRVQGCATLIFALLVVLAGIGLAFAAFGLLILMVSLLLSVPFGTLAYLAIYGFFNRGGASVILSLLMALKVGFAISLVIAQERFLQNTGLVALVLTSFVATVIVSFLQGFPPGVLVSITDAIAALIVSILAIIWAILMFIGSLGSIGNTLQLRL
jgi:VanZ family protein